MIVGKAAIPLAREGRSLYVFLSGRWRLAGPGALRRLEAATEADAMFYAVPATEVETTE